MTVYLVGAGPGDPGLITARGLELVRTCDALVYDRLVSPELVDEAPVGALRIARDRLAQEEIDDLLVRLGRLGRKVVLADGEVGYDSLVIAAGARHHYFGHPEWEERAPGLKSIEDAALAFDDRCVAKFEDGWGGHDSPGSQLSSQPEDRSDPTADS